MSGARTTSQWTPQQAAAITTRNVSVGLSAGAGCGKTSVLTERFLAHLEPANDPAELSQLVAITFTDKAAREMRDRIRQTCLRRVQHGPAAEVDYWQSILRGLDAARISTFHSFCGSLLRSNAVEVGLDPGFGLLDAGQAAALRKHAARECFHRLLELQHPAAVQFVLQFGLADSLAKVEQLIELRVSSDGLSAQDWTVAATIERWQTVWRKSGLPQLEIQLRQSTLTRQVANLLGRTSCSKPVMTERIECIRSLLSADERWSDVVATLQQLREAATIKGVKPEHWESPDDHELVKELFGKWRRSLDKLLELHKSVEIDHTPAATLGAFGSELLKIAAVEYDRQKGEQSLLDFDDLLIRTRDLLRSSENVRRRTAHGIRLLMVDEFQDTDPIQAEIVRMLVGDQLTRGKLFFVGDAKQSIYRFRRADPGVFHHLRAELPATGRLPLSVNFRSQPAIINFVNFVFSRLFGEDYEALVAHHSQLSPEPAIEWLWADLDATPSNQSKAAATSDAESSANQAGEDQSSGIADSANDDEDATGPDDDRSADRRRACEAEWIARRVRQLLDDPTPLVRDKDASGSSRLRRVEARDIVILFRTLSDVALYEHALHDWGIEYYLVGGKAFYAQQEVYDLINLCRVLAHPEDEIALAGVLRSPLFNLSDDGLQVMFQESGSLGEGLLRGPGPTFPPEQRERLQFAQRVLSELRANKDRLPIVDLLERALELTGYDAALLLEFLGPRKVANLRKLIHMAASFDAREVFTLQDYVNRLSQALSDEEDEAFAATLAENDNVVRLMTIHQSKGLEFPVVIVANMDRQEQASTPPVVVSPQLGVLVKLPKRFGKEPQHWGFEIHKLLETTESRAESLRLLYVALTRAADRLILSGAPEPHQHDAHRFELKSIWLQELAQWFDLRTGLPARDPYLAAQGSGVTGRESIPNILVHRKLPKARQPRTTRSSDRPLTELPEQLVQAEPAEIPRSFTTIAPRGGDQRLVSASTLEELVAKLYPPPARTTHRATRATKRSEQSDVADEHEWLAGDATALGTLVHAALERLAAEPQQDAAAIDWVALAREKSLTPDPALLQSGRQLLHRFVDSPLYDEFASATKRYGEVDVVLGWSASDGLFAETAITATLDCLLQFPDGSWRIWDYKTGLAEADRSDAELLSPYEFQLGVYALALEGWLGHAPASVDLIYLRPKPRRVSFAWTDAQRQRTQTQLHAAIRAYRSPETAD